MQGFRVYVVCETLVVACGLDVAELEVVGGAQSSTFCFASTIGREQRVSRYVVYV